MQEREYYRKQLKKFTPDPETGWFTYSAAELESIPREPIGHGFRWGNWRLNRRNLTLTHVPQDYEIDLEKLTTPAVVLDWIFQVTSKTWCTKEDAGDLLEALHMLLNPQQNLCSFGRNMTCNATAILRKRLEPARKKAA